MFAVGSIESGRFLLHVGTCSIIVVPGEWGAQHLFQSHYLVHIVEKIDKYHYNISLAKDIRFKDFKPSAVIDQQEYDWFVNNNSQAMPLWKLTKARVIKLIQFCIEESNVDQRTC